MTVPTQSAAPLSRTEKQALLRKILVERISRVRTEPASFAQERLWFLDRMGDAGATYNMPQALRLSGPVDVPALERALGDVVRRHESLRTSFAESDGTAMQVITPFAGFTLPVEDLTSTDADDRDAEVRRRAAQDAARPFDLATGPLFRAALLRLGAEEHVLLLCTHHVVSDAWSMGVFFRELSALYAAFAAGTEPSLPALPMQYADFATAQRGRLNGEALDRELAWWRERLAGAPALLDLPTDRPRPAVQTYRGASERFELPGALVERLQAVARAEGATLYMLMLGAFQVLLGKYAGSDDVVVGSPIAGRTRPEVEGLIGFFVNTLVMRTDLSGDPSFREVVRRVRATTLGAYAHQEVPFERLVAELAPDRSLSHSPLFQAMFTLNEVAGGSDVLPGVRAERVEAETAASKFDLLLAVAADGSGLAGEMVYATDVFEGGTIRRMLGHLRRVLEQVAADAELRLSQLELLRPAERALVLTEWNRTVARYPGESSIAELFAEQAARTPDAVAVVFDEDSLTYAELDARANRLANHLAAAGVGAESRVGLCLERGPELIVAILAILKAGGAYVPLDPAYPAERLAFMLADSGVAVLVTQESLRAALPAADGVVTVSIDGDAEQIANGDPAIPCSLFPVPSNGLAYVIYTSGSTGTPKGVAVEHRSVVRLVRGANYVSLGADEVILQAAPVSFDASTLEIWGALLNGGRLVMMAGANPSLEALGRALVRHRVTTLWLTAGLFQVMVQERLEDLAGVRQLLAGGDVLPVDAVARVRSRFPAMRLINGYGPTENTTFTCCHTVDETWSGGPVPIGSPISNTRVYVLDAALRPLPAGVPGELYAGGDGVARGYLNRAALTAERFVPDPFGSRPGARLYRTGDRARWRANGTVEYLGRLDEQVKVRGFRIELGEIESVLRRHAGVVDCAVIVRGDEAGDRRVVAYVVGAVDADELRAHLRRSLPDHMVPGAIVAMDALPLTPNGKVDRKALPAPEAAAQTSADGFVAPRTPAEEVLAGIWAELLRVERVGRHDDFFALGGHSLLATRVVSRVRAVFGVELPLRQLFEGPTVAELAERVEWLRRAGLPQLPPVVAADRTRALPLSFAQERLWFLDRMEPGSPFYNVPAAVRLGGALDAAALERAFGEVIRRHESLRTVFAEAEGGPVQVIQPFAGFILPIDDLRSTDADGREAQVKRLAAEDAARPFDLAAGPLLRASLLRLADDEHVLLLCIHHVVSDGWSMGILFRELWSLYETYKNGAESVLPSLPVQYADYAVWQRRQLQGAVLDAQVAYWKEQLAGAPALLELPTDHPRPAVQTYRGAREAVELPAALVRRLQAVARGEGATLYMVMLAAFEVLLGKYAGTEDVVVGSPIAGRTRPETEELIGFFVNTLVLRTELGGDPAFREVVRRVRAATLGAYAHQDVPFERLVAELHPDRSLSHSPLFQVMFSLNEALGETDALPGMRVEPVGAETESAKFDLLLALATDEGGLAGGVVYSTDLFDAATVRRMVGHLRRVLEQVADDADTRLSALELPDAAERALVLHAWNRTEGTYPRDASVHALFAEQAALAPQQVAVVSGDHSMTYAELDARSSRLANHLLRLGVRPEDRVGICLERGLEMMVAVVAILKAGGAYLPLDPEYPRERLAFMVADSGVRVVLTQESVRGVLPADADGVAIVDLAEARERIAAERADDPRVTTGPRGLACVIYTSGSTGTPKGVSVEHRGVVRLVRGTDYMSLGPADRIGQASNVAFDAATYEIWGPLLNGGTMVVIPREVALSSVALAEAIRTQGITALFLTTALFNGIARERPEVFAALDSVLFGGEASDPVAVRRVLAEGAPGQLLHLYGPTENTTYSSWHKVESVADGAQTVPIGRTVAHSTLWVLDGALRPTPIGVPGELYVGGDGVARGYLGRAALTAERFVPDPFAAEPGARMYRTGDRVRWTAEGTVEYLARLDGQVKVRGFRIEIGEIEATLRRHPDVADCAVVARAMGGDTRLVAYVVGGADADALRAHLRETLPDYMVPSAFVAMDALPITPNGKVDRKALPEPDFAAAADAYTAPRTPTEEVLAGIWAEVLNVPRAGVHDDFFALGGHSLLATRVVSRIRAVFGVEMPLRQLFEGATVAQVAERVEALRRAGLPRLAPIVPVERTDALPLSFAQERLWFLSQMEPDSPFYNVPMAVRLRGALDASALERAFGEVVRRHEALRTVFREAQGGPVQVVTPFAGVSLPVRDLSALGAAEREAEVQRLAAEHAARPFDLATGPLFRPSLLRVDGDDHVLLICVHHAVSDGWSLGVLFRELSALYGAYCGGGESPLPEPALQYADYAVWQRDQLRGEALDLQLAYWKDQLAGAPALLELPTDHARPAEQTFRGAMEVLELSPDLLERLRALGRREGATLYMVLLGAFQTLLSKYAGTTDVLVGTPVAGRTRCELEQLMGVFVNTLVLRTDLSGDPAFGEVLRRVRAVTLGAFEHQELPFEKVVAEVRPERSLSHAPLFQVMLTLMDGGREPEAGLPGLAAEAVKGDAVSTKFDMTLAFGLGDGGFRAVMEYGTDLFERATIQRTLRHLARVLEQVADGADPRMSQLELLDDAERRVVVQEWNRTDAPYPATECIHTLFQAQAARTPHAPAATDDAGSATYAELNARANRLANHLIGLGVGPESRVGILQARGVEMLVSLLAVLKAGGAYVPLDPAYPADRLGFILGDARVAVLLTETALQGLLPVPDGVHEIAADRAAAQIARASAENPAVRVTPRGLAYLIYTSGSTGVPKGVAIEHESAVALLSWAKDIHTAEELGGMLGSTSICFDLSVYELFLPLAQGGRVIIVENALGLPTSPAAADVRLVNTVPSAAAALLKTGGIPSGVTTVNMGGEPLRTELVDALYAYGIRRVYDLYGPTEDTVYSTWMLRRAGARATIGRAISNTQAYVLDAALRPVPAGVPGELFLAGRGLARGYMNRPSLTADRFIPDPCGTVPGGRMYRTGDRVRWTHAGELEYLGRLDHQVKVRGYRIELGEIDTALRKHPSVRDCAVIVREDAPGDQRLVAYLAGDADAEALRAHLRTSLPEYMVPAAFVMMEALPLTPNGKLDRKALPAPEYAAAAASLPPRSELERTVAGVWQEVLGVAPGVTDNFFDLGGSSLLLTRVYSGLREIRPGLRMVDLFRYTTVEALAGYLGAEEQGEASALAESRARAQERRSLRRRG